MKTLLAVVPFVLVLGCQGRPAPSGDGNAPATVGDPGAPEGAEAMPQADLVRVLTELTGRTPDGWYVENVRSGEVVPPGWTAGRGCCIRLASTPRPSGEGRGRARWGAGLYLIDLPHALTRPGPKSTTGPRAITLEELQALGVPPAVELEAWGSRQVLAAIDDANAWPTFHEDVGAAMSASGGSAATTRQLGRTRAIVGHLEVGPPRSDLYGEYWPGVIRDKQAEANLAIRLRPWLTGEGGAFSSGDYLVCLRGSNVMALLPLAPPPSPPPPPTPNPTIHSNRAVVVGLSTASPSPGPVNVHAYIGQRLMGSWIVRVGAPGVVIGVPSAGFVTLKWTWPDGRAAEKKIKVRNDPVRVWLDKD